MWEFGVWEENVNLEKLPPTRWTGAESNDRVKSFIVALTKPQELINCESFAAAIRPKVLEKKRKSFDSDYARDRNIQTISHSRRVTITNSLIKHRKCKSTFHDTTAKAFVFVHIFTFHWLWMVVRIEVIEKPFFFRSPISTTKAEATN